jgi:cell division protein FtsB
MTSTTTASMPQGNHPTGPKRIRIGRWILIVSVLFALYAWTFGPYGIIRQQRTAERLATLQMRNDSLRLHLRVLEDSLRLLSNDSATIAGEARRLGLVLPGEVAVRFVDTNSIHGKGK